MKLSWSKIVDAAKKYGPDILRFLITRKAKDEAAKRGDTLRKLVIAAMVITSATVNSACGLSVRDIAGLIPKPSPTPEVSPASPEPPPASPTPSQTPPPSPQATPTPDTSPSPVATPKPPKACNVDPDKLPCWLARQRLDYETREGGDSGWIETGQFNGNFFRGQRGNVVMYIRCDGKGSFAKCYSTRPDGSYDASLPPPGHGSVFGTWFPEGYPANPEHVQQGLCAQAYLDSLCPKPSPTPEVTPSPETTPPPSGRSCPALVRVGGGLFNCQIKGQPIPCGDVLPAGSSVTLDHTYHWRQNGPGSCDEPRDTACGAGVICDDFETGLNFTQSGPTEGFKSATHQYTVRNMARGNYSVTACAQASWVSPNGPVDGSKATCKTTTWTVQ